MSSFNPKKFRQFIIDSVPSSYAAGDRAAKTKESDGSTTITFTKGKYKLHDNYFGGEPYGGREVVFLDGRPAWMMVYYGFVQKGAKAKTMYAFLMKALRNPPDDFPFRGPQVFEEGKWRYENTWNGDESCFSGIEKIFVFDACVYEASYAGGLIDCKRQT